MPPANDNNQAEIQKAAEQHVTEILERREQARATRAKALNERPKRISVKTELTRTAAMADAAAVPQVSTGTAETAGYLLAAGDSWFDYPIQDVLTKLEDNFGYNIESTAHRGDPIETMVSHVGQLDKFARLLDKLAGLGASPKAILLSGGGDDIAGQEFGMLINNIDLLPIPGWNDQVLAGVIDTRIAAAYRLMFTQMNLLCQQHPAVKRKLWMLVHGYDYPVPDGRGFLGGWGPLPGPWLKPGFDEKLFTDLPTTTAMMKQIIDRFNTMLQNVVAEAGFENVRYVDLRGTFSNVLTNNEYQAFWANELHPTGADPLAARSDGFGLVAAKFEAVLTALPPAPPAPAVPPGSPVPPAPPGP